MGSTSKAAVIGDTSDLAALAAHEFQPWVADGTPMMNIRDLTKAATNGAFPAAALAHHLMFRTKDQLVESCGEKEGIDTLLNLAESLDANAAWMDSISNMMKTASYRILVAASAANAS